ncbi:retinol dehydrogenase 13-like isoform X2 [Protopterus annectens]|uniref:retinol dehydrogenase 13-like isoform X2 n=1 Tax=Protopterus annectens TaxID=7888 RepID=UPI001CFC1EA9|nr:retinol dehydrogenase 13-like isoform X2 [Protopterus annectens]
MTSTSDMQEYLQKHASEIAALSVAGIGLVFLRRWFAGGVCKNKARLDGKTVIVTGANVGIGRETAKDLAKRGARVILACRNLEQAAKAADEIRKESGNGNVTTKHLDLSSLASVRRFAKDVQESESALHILINNAGIMMCPKWKTEDGFEIQFGVNHLGHFLLTNLLLDLLKKSAPSRIINVSSLAHEKGKIHFDDINLDKDYEPRKSYGQSKLANVLFTRELAVRLAGTGVSVYSLHPGVVRTELGRHIFPTFALWKRMLGAPLLLFMMKTPLQGAQTTIHCATADDKDLISGTYFSDCAPKEPAPQAKDDEAARKLWELSAQMVGLDK